MRVRLIASLTAVLVAVGIALTAGPAAAAPAPTAATPRATIAATPINQVVSDPTGTIKGTFVGTFTPTGFTTSNGHLVANGLLNGTYTPAAGGLPTTITDQTASAPVLGAASPHCTILDLTLGPLHLNLLGLVVDLNQVHLVITAVPGPGNLLGNLLCSVANLLNGGLSAGGLATLLNQLLGLLGGL